MSDEKGQYLEASKELATRIKRLSSSDKNSDSVIRKDSNDESEQNYEKPKAAERKELDTEEVFIQLNNDYTKRVVYILIN